MRVVMGIELVWPSQVGAESPATVKLASPAAAPFSASKSSSETRPSSRRVSPFILYVAYPQETLRLWNVCPECFGVEKSEDRRTKAQAEREHPNHAAGKERGASELPYPVPHIHPQTARPADCTTPRPPPFEKN